MIGLPGSGKTTTARLFREATGARDGYTLARNIGGYANCLRLAPTSTLRTLLHPAIAGLAGRIVLLVRLRQEILLRADDHLLFEEGAIHRAWLLRQTLPRRSTSRLPVRPICPVVALDVPPAIAYERIRHAGKTGPVNQLLGGHPPHHPVWRQAVNDYRVIRDQLDRDGSLTVLDNTGRPEAAVAKIASLMDLA